MELNCSSVLRHFAQRKGRVLGFCIWGLSGSEWGLRLVCAHKSHPPPFSFQITGQAHVSLKSIIRCARGSWQASSARRRCAVPPLGEPGAIPVRCAQPSLSPAAGASSPTSAPEPVRVSQLLLRIYSSIIRGLHDWNVWRRETLASLKWNIWLHFKVTTCSGSSIMCQSSV